MAKAGSCNCVLFLCLLLLGGVLPVEPHQAPQPVPALYVFGDSIVDSGNNNYLLTIAKANYLPYGKDFKDGPTGRFTNGKTVADFLAEQLGLPLVPPYLSLSEIQKEQITTGFNYGSGSAGILSKTGKVLGNILDLETQINMFTNTVKNNLTNMFGSSKELSQYLSKSIFMVNMGNNDYLNTYVYGHALGLDQETAKHRSPQNFSKLLTDELSKHLQSLYALGARKFVVAELGPIGCMPTTIKLMGSSGGCVEEVNNAVTIFNQKLSALLENLQSTLQGSIFVRPNVYSLFMELKQNAAKYGFVDVRSQCCVDMGNGTLPCKRSQPACNDVDHHFFFDPYHPTQAVNSILTSRFYNDSSACTPMSIQKLVRA